MLSQTTVFTHLVRDYMGSPPVHCAPNMSCIDVVGRMRDLQVSSAIVVNDA